jgi:hypothetical protein
MPRYEVRITIPWVTDRSRAVDVLARRFPEIDVIEQHQDRVAREEVWICRAPSATHVERWATESDLRFSIEQEQP